MPAATRADSLHQEASLSAYVLCDDPTRAVVAAAPATRRHLLAEVLQQNRVAASGAVRICFHAADHPQRSVPV